MSFLFTASIILLACAIFSKFLYKYGIPTLIIFLAIGMFMGSEGPGGIIFNDLNLAENLCNIGLIFIIFSGGFGTNWEKAKPVASPAILLASLGVILTALFAGVFIHFALGFSIIEGMLLGSIVASTDVASVFSILRSRKLNLKNNLVPMLEMESGSNDPIAYMLTSIFLGMIIGEVQNVWLLLLSQIIVGALVGIIVGKLAVKLINHINLDIDGLYSVIAIGIVLLSFSGAEIFLGSGFLAVYITGMIMGNSKLAYKISLVRYFDGLSWFMQILLFFTLGLLVVPSELPKLAWKGISVAIFIIIVARPLSVFIILKIFKRPLKDKLLISWVGFRGADSIVFATYTLARGIDVADEIFNIVLYVTLVSVLVQGTFLVSIVKKLGLIEHEETVFKTFNDYSGEIYAELLEIKIHRNSIFADKAIKDIDMPKDVIIVMIKRGNRMITPRESTIIQAYDILLLAGNPKELMRIDEKENI